MKNDATIVTPTKKNAAIITHEIEREVRPYHRNIAPTVVNTTRSENHHRETANLIRSTAVSYIYLTLLPPL